MFIQEFVKEHGDRYIIVFAEEKPYTVNTRGSFAVHRSSFAFLYDTYVNRYVISTWAGVGPVAAYGPSSKTILDTMVPINTAADFDNVVVPEDGITHRWVGMIKNFIGDEDAITAFNRLLHPLKKLEKHQLDGAVVAPNRSQAGVFKFFGRYVSFDKRKHYNGGGEWSVQYGRIVHPTSEVDFAGFPSLLTHRKCLLTLNGGRKVRYGTHGTNFVVQINEPSDFYYLYLLKEQQKLQSKWSYKIKSFFGMTPKSKGFLSNIPTNNTQLKDSAQKEAQRKEPKDVPLSSLFPRD